MSSRYIIILLPTVLIPFYNNQISLFLANVTAVFVYRITDLSTGQSATDPVDFEGVEANTDNSYDMTDASFTALADGHYFMGKHGKANIS